MSEKLPQLKMLCLDVDGTLTDGGIYIDANGLQSRRFDVKDGLAIKNLRKQGFHVGIISHSVTPDLVLARAKMLDIELVYVGGGEKTEVLADWCKELGISPKDVGYVGDDINDLTIMQMCGHSGCPSNAVTAIKNVTDVVLSQPGGVGAVREYIDRFIVGA